MARDLIRVGIIGAGFIGEKHGEAYAQNSRVKVTAVIDTRGENANRLAEKVGGKAYGSLEQMLANETIDALDVCLPTMMHKEAVIKAVRAGLDVLVEKPFALNTEDIDLMIGAAREQGKRLMVAHVCRFMPEYIFAKAIVEKGEFGKPLFFGAWRESATPNWSWNNWLRDRQLSGGTIMDLSIHDIDLSNWLLGVPTAFYGQEVTKPGKEGPSHVISSLTYSNGSMATIEAGHLLPASYPFTTGYRLLLEQGAIEFYGREHEERLIRIFSDKEVKIIDVAQLPGVSTTDPYAEELNHFVDCLLTGADFRISVDEAKLAVSTVQKLRESIRMGQKISIDVPIPGQ
ncbi:MAG: Gfo/Idh/MocA family oxidoreductase [Firmicutes bacterium]|nr:Gfo/Idh/MocA family oxidoreductase [Bacillota bacterium]